MIGKTLAHYEITGLLGKGGMGEVYRARDTKLGRDVALKILPEELARDAERRARFEREARTLASIQHANIASIHDFDEAEGYRFLVMELAEGQDLAEILQRGPVPLDEALNIARQVALGLQAAHDVGIVHRDLKPANVMLATNGDVKILDFGLARAFEAGDDERDLKESPTITAHMTHAGVILGTAAYMSPEQARGKRIDRRTDIWAFGCVLFEMLSGRQAFPGDTVSDVIAKIIQGEPAWQELPDAARPALRKLLRRCLNKDPNARLHDIADARLEIDEIVAHPEGEAPQAAATPASAPRRRAATLLPWFLTALLAVALVLALTVRSGHEHDLVQFEVFAPPQHVVTEFDVSPDGRSLAIVARDTERTHRLWFRPLDSTDMKALPLTEGAAFPFWSADGRSIAFFAAGKLKRIDIASETIQTIADAPNGRGGAWSPDDVILFTPEGRGGLYVVPASGGTVEQVTHLSGNEASHRLPHFLPDGRRFTYVVQGSSGSQSTRMMGSLDSDAREVLLEGNSEVFAPPGYVLFVRERTLMAQRFNAEAGTLEGPAVPLAKQIVEDFTRIGRVSFSVSDAGVLAYYQVKPSESELVWWDRSGRRLEAVSAPGAYAETNASPRLSPDGRRIGFLRADPAAAEIFAIWVLDIERGTASRVTPFSRDIVSAAWSHDGESLLYATGDALLRTKIGGVGGAGDADTLWAANAVGDGDPTAPTWVSAVHVASDGSTVVFNGWNSQTDMDVWLLPLDGKRRLRALARGPRRQDEGRVSPNGDWVAYSSEESGRSEIYVVPTSGSGAKTLVSTAGGSNPRWNRDGRELVYVSADQQLMAVRVHFDPTFQAEQPIALFETPEGPMFSDWTSALIAADGDRFLFNVQVPGTKPPSITVVLNWEELLQP